MKKTLYFSKIDWNGTGRKINAVDVEIELRDKLDGPAFSAMAMIWNNKHTDIVCGGQCLDELMEFLGDNEIFAIIHKMWKLYHLNDMHVGTPRQEEALKKAGFLGGKNYNYKEACEYLKSINLYDDNGKVYGKNWYYWPIPDEDLEIIKSLFFYGE